MATLDDISMAVQRGKRKDIKKLIPAALDEGISPQEILDSMIEAMGIIGDRFTAGEVFVPEMLVAARAMTAGTDILNPLLSDAGAKPLGKAVIGTVKDDMHDIGKNLVRMMIGGKGIDITDLGVDVETERFVQFVKDNPDTDLVCLSALLTTTMPHLKEVVDAITDAGLRDQVLIMIGGAPVTQEFADEIGADAYTPDAGSAAAKAAELLAAKTAA